MDLQRVFAGVPRIGHPVDGCTYCYAQSDLELLGGDPQAVPDDLVGSFAREVTDHWSEREYWIVWRGLAPRILRQLEEVPDTMMLKGLAFARFSSWPKHEQDALRGELRAMLARAITGDRAPIDVYKLVCAAAHVDHDLKPWLDYLDTLTGPDADAGIARLAHVCALDVVGSDGPLLWWYPDDPGAPIREWLQSDALRGRLSAADTLDLIAQLETN